MNLTKIVNERYSTKAFDPTKKVSAEQLERIKTLLRMSPSSTNLQPWHVIIAGTEAGKQRMAQGVQGDLKFNEPKMLNASHVLLFCARTDADEAYLQHLFETEDRDGRYPNEEVKRMVNKARHHFVNLHKEKLDDLRPWMEKQVYINLGGFLLGVAALGIDACPMEGIDVEALNREFDLPAKGYTALAAVSIGYRSEQDFNIPSKTPKSRLPLAEIITEL